MKKLLATCMIAFALLFPTPVFAQVNVFPQCGTNDLGNSRVCNGGGKLFGAGSIWNRILNTITYLGGAAAVLVIVIAGIRYILSGGDQSQITMAKNTILYAAVGLIIAMMANAIINFILTNV
jgi:hypothetical protein